MDDMTWRLAALRNDVYLMAAIQEGIRPAVNLFPELKTVKWNDVWISADGINPKEAPSPRMVADAIIARTEKAFPGYRVEVRVHGIAGVEEIICSDDPSQVV